MSAGTKRLERNGRPPGAAAPDSPWNGPEAPQPTTCQREIDTASDPEKSELGILGFSAARIAPAGRDTVPALSPLIDLDPRHTNQSIFSSGNEGHLREPVIAFSPAVQSVSLSLISPVRCSCAGPPLCPFVCSAMQNTESSARPLPDGCI